MAKLEPFDSKITNWVGLWWHPEHNEFTSAVFDLSDLQKFKGKVRLCVRKNRNFNGGENNRPNYNFCLRDAKSDIFTPMEARDDNYNNTHAHQDVDGRWYTNNGERLYTENEARRIIDGAYDDFRYGITDPWDVLPEDFV